MRAAKVQASLRIRAVSPEPSLLAHISSESRGSFRQKARSLAPLNAWACAVKICHDGMLEDTNSLDGAHINLRFNTKLKQDGYSIARPAPLKCWTNRSRWKAMIRNRHNRIPHPAPETNGKGRGLIVSVPDHCLSFYFTQTIEPCHENSCWCHMLTTKVQIS